MRAAAAGAKARAARWTRDRALGLTLVLVASTAAGCVSARRGAGGLSEAPPGAPWELPPGAFPSQRLFQGSYEGPEGGGSFRATLRLLSPERYRLDASDRLGRLLWSLGVDGSRAWWIDHARNVWCPEVSRLTLPGIGRGPVEATALPAILLGWLPAVPAGGTQPSASGALELRDGAGRRWTGTVTGGRVSSWTLWEDGEALWWWRRQGRGGILSQRQGRQLRWQEVVAEPLRGDLPPRPNPSGYAEACDGPSSLTG